MGKNIKIAFIPFDYFVIWTMFSPTFNAFFHKVGLRIVSKPAIMDCFRNHMLILLKEDGISWEYMGEYVHFKIARRKPA
jgi:hypothetical protein